MRVWSVASLTVLVPLFLGYILWNGLSPNAHSAMGQFVTNLEWLELRRLPPNSAPDSGVIFHAAAGVGPPRTDIRKSEEKLHLKDSYQTRTGRAQRGPYRRYALLSLQTRLLAVFYALGTG